MNFQQQVLNKIKSIPRGKVTTYKVIAYSLKSKAYRAVGSACKNNPTPIKIPCHRVIPSSGKVGNYTLGQKKKIHLLKKEGIEITKGKINQRQILSQVDL